MSAELNSHDGHDDIVYPSMLPFLSVHFGCLAAIWTGVTWEAAALCFGMYWLRMFAITAGYHRYFAHRAYSTSRVFQFVLAFLAQSSLQKSILWWVATHRHHHLHSDTPSDVHSPRHKGFFHSHLGWMFTPKHDVTDLTKVADWARYPELMWLHKYEVAPAVVVAACCYLIAGWSGFVVGFLWSTVLLFHAVFGINSLAHVHGKQRHVTGDDSRNNWFLAVLTMGEGWHNNHHAYQASARQGFKWWEIDLTFYILKLFSWLGIVWDLKTPPAALLRNEQRLGSRVISRASEDLAARFPTERIALAITSELPAPQLTAMQDALIHARRRLSELLPVAEFPQMPTRDEILAEARAMFAKTPSLDEIVDRAYDLVLASVETHLISRLQHRP